MGPPSRPEGASPGDPLEGFGLMLLEAVAWSLLWSVVLSSSLQAAVGELLTVGLLGALCGRGRSCKPSKFWVRPWRPPVPRLVLAGAARRPRGWSSRGQRLHAGTACRRDRMGPADAGPTRPAVRRLILGDRARVEPDLAPAGGGVGRIARGVGAHVPVQNSRSWSVFGVLIFGVAAGCKRFRCGQSAQSYRFLAYHGDRRISLGGQALRLGPHDHGRCWRCPH